MRNLLLSEFKTPFKSAPFSKILPEHFISAIRENISDSLNSINLISKRDENPTFDNTIIGLQESSKLLGRNVSLLFNLNSAETSIELQKVTQEIAPYLSKYKNDILLNEKLFERVKFVYLNSDKSKLTPEEITLLKKEFNEFVRNGALLTEKKKKKLRVIDELLAIKTLSYGEKILDDTNSYFLHVTNEKKLKGLPDSSIIHAASIAETKNLNGWIFTLDAPSYIPFITYSEIRSLRKEISEAYGSRGFKENKNNTLPLIEEIINLRHKRSKILGFESHAHFILEERMSLTEKKTNDFIDKLYMQSFPFAKKEWDELTVFSKKNLGINNLEKWDLAYATEKLKKSYLELDELELKKYFSLNKVLLGLFKILEKLYGIYFIENNKIDVYSKLVKTYEVYDRSKKFKSLLYLDLYPREGKRSGAWMTSFVGQKKNQRPHISVVCNFPNPSKLKPSLISFQEVTTLFHEFGHALHGMLANTRYESLSGTNVLWDFVELPSQIMENWCYEEEALELFARHYKTNKLMPKSIIKKIKASSHFQQGIQTIRQLGLASLDLSYHSKNSCNIKNIKEHEDLILNKYQFLKSSKNQCLSSAFSHIFQGGYSSGYYSYKWAEVLDADAFELFLENGIFNTKIAKKFEEHVLSKGGTEHPMKLYKRFRGKEPDPNALVRRAGLILTR